MPDKSDKNATYYDLKSFCKENFSDKIHNIVELKNFMAKYCPECGEIKAHQDVRNKEGGDIKCEKMLESLNEVKRQVDDGSLVLDFPAFTFQGPS